MISSTYTGEIYDSSAATEVVRTDSETGLGQDAFLKMFLAQVTNQDPMNPMDNTEFTAQLATFSQLEQLTQIADSMEGIKRMEAAINQNTIMSYIGREVTISGNTVPVTDGQAGTLSYNLAATGDVRVVVTSAGGATVHTEELGMLTEGKHEYTWSATDSWGDVVSDGNYTITVTAYDNNGETIDVTDVTVSSMCTGFETDEDGNQYLIMGSGSIAVSDVLGVRSPASGISEAASQAASAEDDSDWTLEDLVSTVLKISGLAAALL